MATLPFTPLTSLTLPNQTKLKPHHTLHSFNTTLWNTTNYNLTLQRCSYKVVIEQDGSATELDVDEDETILSKALDHGLTIPHDCKLGVCMTCPARLVSGSVDQSEGMLSDHVIHKGYALLCASYPRSDCRLTIIPQEELLFRQLVTAQD